MKELNCNERKEWAKLIFTTCNKSIEDVALEVDTEVAELRHWATTNQWPGYKDALLTAKDNQLEMLRDQVVKICEKLKGESQSNAKDTDLYLKYIAAIKTLEEEPSVSCIIEVFELFVQWLRRKDKALTKKFIPHLDAFVNHRIAA